MTSRMVMRGAPENALTALSVGTTHSKTSGGGGGRILNVVQSGRGWLKFVQVYLLSIFPAYKLHRHSICFVTASNLMSTVLSADATLNLRGNFS